MTPLLRLLPVSTSVLTRVPRSKLNSLPFCAENWLVALLIMLMFLLEACSSQQSEGPLTAAPLPVAKEATFAGRTAEPNLFAAVVTHGNGMDVYFCDGTRDFWFRSVSSDVVQELEDSTGAKLSLEFVDNMVVGHLSVGEARTSFALPKVQHEALYRAEANVGEKRMLGGWIVLANGEQRGAIRQANSVTVASTLVASPPGGNLPPRIVCNACPENSTPLTAAALTPQTAQRVVNKSQKFTVIGLGDSFMSGEGAPVVKGALTQSTPLTILDAQGIGVQEVWSDGLPTSVQHAFNLSAAEVSRLNREARACHRGVSGLGEAVKALRATWPNSVDIIHQTYACSGAVVANLIDQPYSGPGGCGSKTGLAQSSCLRYADDLSSNDIRPQWSDARTFLASQSLVADAVVMSIGGNDFGFGTVVGDCLISNCDAASSASQAVLANGEREVPGRYRLLAETFSRSGVPKENVYLTQHPNPLNKNATELCAGSDFLPDLVLALVTTEEARFAQRFMGAINGAAANTATDPNIGWRVITPPIGAETGHGMCTGDPWFNTRLFSLFTQGQDRDEGVGNGIGFTSGMFHPNENGQRGAYMPGYQAALDTALRTRFTPKRGPMFRAVAFRNANGRAEVDLRWDDPNSFESKNVLVNSLNGVVVTTGPDATRATVALTGTRGSFNLKTCFIGPAGNELCSADTPPLEVEVKVPTHAPSSVNNVAGLSPTDPKWLLSWNDAAPSRLYTTLEIERSGVITREAVLGQSFQVPYAAGRNSFRVAACNDLGCGPPSSWQNFVPLQPPPPAVTSCPAGRTAIRGTCF
jgi:hypothetical protein